MGKRFVFIWFCHLKTDWVSRRQPALRAMPLVLTSPDHGRMLITAVNPPAQSYGIDTGMVLADARVIYPSLQIMDDRPGLSEKLMKGLADWCIRYSPVVALHPPDGLILDATGCAHLWGGEEQYIKDIQMRFTSLGYNTHVAMADTAGAAYAVAHHGKRTGIVAQHQTATALLPLPVEALRIDPVKAERLHALGLKRIGSIMNMQRSALRRRFGEHLLERLDQATGNREEIIEPVQPVEPYQERLPCLEPIITATGIEIALQRLLETLCQRLQQEQQGLRIAVLKCYRSDNRIIQVQVGTNRPSFNKIHLGKLFELKIDTIEPGPGIDLFILEAQKVEPAPPIQEKLWQKQDGLDNIHLSELLDRFSGKFGAGHIHRFVPDEHYWPERSFKPAATLHEKTAVAWNTSRPRPLQLLPQPERIDVTAPVPDYPPMNFRYKGKLHKIIKADGPERIEQEWWLQQGQHRDYYYVEDEEGKRYWLFRLGHYTDQSFQWFIHGFFA